MLPRASRYTFTLREMARLLEAVPSNDLEELAAFPLNNTVGRFATLVDIAAAQRGYTIPPEREIDDDVVDPFRRGDEAYSLMASQIVPAVDAIVNRFALAATVTRGV